VTSSTHRLPPETLARLDALATRALAATPDARVRCSRAKALRLLVDGALDHAEKEGFDSFVQHVVAAWRPKRRK
jgi:hypothetical protein